MRTALLALLLLAQAPPAPPKRWTFELKSPCYGSPQAADLDGDGRPELVFGTYYGDEHLYALDGKDGSLRWKFKSHGGPFDASVAISDLDGDGKPEIVAGDSGDGTFFCLDSKGKELWTLKLPSGTDSPPAVADLDGDGKPEIVVGTMTTVDGQGRTCCIDPAKRAIRWSAKVPGHVQSEPCLVDLDGDRILDVIVTTWMGDAKVRALSGRDGAELWAFATDEAKEKFPRNSMYHGVTAVEFAKGQLSIVAATCGGGVYCLDAKGGLRWKQRLEGEYLFAPTCAADLDRDGTPELVVAGRDLHVLDAKGRTKWTRKGKEGSVTRGAAVADANGDDKPDLLAGFGTVMVAVDGASGRDLWTFESRTGKSPYEAIGSAPVVADLDGDGMLDLFFVGGKGTSDETKKDNYGRAWSLKLAGKGEGWPMFRGDLRRGGWKR